MTQTRHRPVPDPSEKTGYPPRSAIGGFLRRSPKIISARSHFRHFFYYVARDGRGRELVPSPVHDFLCDLFESCWRNFQNLSIVAMPGLGKTTIAAHMPVWVLGLDPAETVACVSADVSDSTDQVSYIRGLVLDERVVEVFPGMTPDLDRADAKRGWEKSRFFLRPPAGGAQSQNPSVQAVSAIPTKERIRVSFGLFDDLNTRRVAYSVPIRKRLEEAFTNTWVAGRLQNSRGGLGSHGWALSLQNCWLQADLGHVLAVRPDFASVWVGVSEDRSRCLVMVRNLPPESNPLALDPGAYEALPAGVAQRRNLPWDAWTVPLPPGMSKDGLDEMFEADPETFRRSHRLIAPDASDLLFLDWRNCADPDERTAAEVLGAESDPAGLPLYSGDVLDRWTLAAGVDVSGGKRAGNAVSVWARDKTGRKVRCEAWRFGGGYAAIIDKFDELERRGARFRLVNFESNAIQDELRKAILELVRSRGGQAPDWTRRMVGFMTGSNKHDPGKGLPALALEMQRAPETGAIVHPGGSAKLRFETGEGFRALETALDECPVMIAAGKTPDILMADWFGWSGVSDVLGGGRAHAQGGGDDGRPRGVRLGTRRRLRF